MAKGRGGRNGVKVTLLTRVKGGRNQFRPLSRAFEANIRYACFVIWTAFVTRPLKASWVRVRIILPIQGERKIHGVTGSMEKPNVTSTHLQPCAQGAPKPTPNCCPNTKPPIKQNRSPSPKPSSKGNRFRNRCMDSTPPSSASRLNRLPSNVKYILDAPSREFCLVLFKPGPIKLAVRSSRLTIVNPLLVKIASAAWSVSPLGRGIMADVVYVCILLPIS
jgi:hypothetical protein